MKHKVYILENTFYFKQGEIVEAIKTQKGVLVDDHFVSRDQYIPLDEALTKADEKQIKDLVRDVFRKFFWRQWTRSAFLLK